LILYFREGTGDYLAIDTDSNSYCRRLYGKDHFEARATVIAGLVGSICTTAISREFLRRRCKRVGKARVPAEWREAIDYHRGR
jgi:hypothetical protein